MSKNILNMKTSSANEGRVVRSTLKQILVGVSRVAISLTLVSLIVWKVGADNTLNRLSALKLSSLLGAASLVMLTLLLHARRWQIVLSSLNYSWKFRIAFREIWIGYFFNQLLPSSVGGDGVRALRLYRSGISMGTSVRSVLTERIFGLMACVLLSVAAVPIMHWSAPTAPATIAVELTTLLALTGIFVLLRPYSFFMALLPKKIANEVHTFSKIIKNDVHFSHVMGISAAMQISIAGSVALLCWGLGIDANPLLVAALFQPVTLMTLLPVSLAGWGVREGALIAILGAIGITSTDALPLSLAFGAIMLIASLPGWAFFATCNIVKPEKIKADDNL
jgi:uncharacterized protein (TIRG00374 family)